MRIQYCDLRSRVDVCHPINLIRTLGRRLRYAERSDLLGAATAPVLRPLVGPQSFLKVRLAIPSRTGGWTTAYLRPIYGVTGSAAQRGAAKMLSVLTGDARFSWSGFISKASRVSVSVSAFPTSVQEGRFKWKRRLME